VVNSLTLTAGDSALKTRLQSLNYTVTSRTAASATASDANGKTVVVITNTCVPADIGTKFRDVATGVLVLRREAFTNMNMASTHGQTTGTQVPITSVGQTHPLGDGLSGTVAVTTASVGLLWATPPATAVVAATIPNQSGQATVFGYEAGATMVGT